MSPNGEDRQQLLPDSAEEQDSFCCPHCRSRIRLVDISPQEVAGLANVLDCTGAETLKTTEKRAIDRAIKVTPNLREAARLLGIGRTTLYRKLRQHGIENPGRQRPPKP